MINLTENIRLWFLAVIIGAAILYRYLMRNYQYWESQGVRTVKAYPIFGSISVLLKPLHILEQEQYKKYGRIYGRYDGQLKILTVAEPDLVKNILVKDFNIFSGHRDLKFGDPIVDNMLVILHGEDWKRVRSVISPAFTSNKLRNMFHLVDECAEQLLESFREHAISKQNLHVSDLVASFTIDIIGRCAFGIETNALKEPNNPFVANANKFLDAGFSWRSFLVVFFPWTMKLFRISLFNTRVTKFYKDITMELIKVRQENKDAKQRADFLQLVLNARDEDSNGTSNMTNSNKDSSFNKISKKTINNEELISQCTGFFPAGHEPLVSAISNSIYNLSLNPDIQEKLYLEIIDGLKKYEDGYEAISNIKYLDAVLSETLRLCPPSTRLERQAMADYVLGDTGIVIKKGMIASIPIYAMHHDPEFFPSPETFDPDRFMNEESPINIYTYLPFGIGPRNCVAMRLALMVLKHCLLKMVLNFQFEACSETQVPLTYQIKQGVLIAGKVIVSVKERSKTS